MIIHCRSYTNICCNKNLLYTGSHGVVSIRHNFVCNHKRCRFLVFRNFAWGKINALKENLSEKQFFKQIFEDLKKKDNEINSGIIIPLFLNDVTMPLSISSRTTSQYSAYNYMYSHFTGICYIRIHINKFVNNMTYRTYNDQQPSTFGRKIKWKDIEFISKYLVNSSWV